MSDLSSTGVTAADSPGAILRRTREARAMAVEDVANALKLTARQVAAIEADDYASLKGNTFARGFVRNYARVLGLDPAPLLAALDERLGGGEVTLLPPSNARGEMPVADAPRGVSRSLAVLAVTALFGLVVMLAYERYTARPAGAPVAASAPLAPMAPAAPVAMVAGPPPAAVEPRPDGVAAQPVPGGVAAPVAAAGASAEAPPAAVPAPAAAPSARRLEFRFARESWVEVRDGAGRILLSRTNAAGSAQVVEGQPPFALVIGNAPFVTLTYGDAQVDLKPHTAVSVARLSLD